MTVKVGLRQVIKDGRITIQKEIRDLLGIQEGDFVQVGEIEKARPVKKEA